jgi:hypothetical protein
MQVLLNVSEKEGEGYKNQLQQVLYCAQKLARFLLRVLNISIEMLV